MKFLFQKWLQWAFQNALADNIITLHKKIIAPWVESSQADKKRLPSDWIDNKPTVDHSW